MLKPDQQKKFDEIVKKQEQRRSRMEGIPGLESATAAKKRKMSPRVKAPSPVASPLGFSCLKVSCAFTCSGASWPVSGLPSPGCRVVHLAWAYARIKTPGFSAGTLASKTWPKSGPNSYETQGEDAAQELLQQRKRQYHLDVQVLNESGEPVVRGTFPRRAAAFEARQNDSKEGHLPWRRLTAEYTSEKTGDTYLLIYRIAHPKLDEWHRSSLTWPLSALAIALVVLTLFSLFVTLSITRPLSRLRGAVHDLGQATYQQNSLARLANRRDEFGVLATRLQPHGARLQSLIGSQRQLLRDASHELRSPLARLRIALALAERAGPEEREKLWPRLTRECDRLEALISEILVLARVDADNASAEDVDLNPLLKTLQKTPSSARQTKWSNWPANMTCSSRAGRP